MLDRIFGTVQCRTGGSLCAGYDAPNFRDMGLVRDMGGIGAHNEASQLRLRFVRVQIIIDTCGVRGDFMFWCMVATGGYGFRGFMARSRRLPLQEDYKTVVDFAKRPWAYKVDWRVHCIEKPFDGAALQPPVQLVIFDFDGALTLYTFMPEDTGENSPFASC